MNRYIDSKKLIAEIKRQIESAAQKADISYSVDDVENEKKYDDERNVLERLLGLITSLQQEQTPTEREIAEAHRYAEMIRERDKERIQQEQPEPSNNLVDVDAVREDFITEVYRVLDADPTNDRANAIINAFDSLPTVSQEQPEVDFKEELDDFISEFYRHYTEYEGQYIKEKDWRYSIEMTARHFYELGLNARKEE